MRSQASNIDQYVIDAAQWLYDLMLDQFGTRIGTFRMVLAICPIGGDLVVRSLRGYFLVQLSTTAVFMMILFGMFYNFRTMKLDNKLQSQNNLKVINLVSHQFRAKTFYTRMFYLGFFTLSALLYRDLARIGLISIVFTRCVKVRSRVFPGYQGQFYEGLA